MKKPVQTPAAVVFDFDGVIVDTEPLHCEAFRRILAPLGVTLTWEDYVSRYLGFDDRDAFREILKDAAKPCSEAQLPGLIEAKAQAFQDLVEGQGAKPYPGVVELIRSLAGCVPVALCSGALRRDVAPILRRLGIAELFDVIVTADEVATSKPDPESYVLAVRRLAVKFSGAGIDPSCCVAVEDTPAGIAAARAAGLKVLALANSYPVDQLGAATCVIASLAGVTAGDLGRLVFDAA